MLINNTNNNNKHITFVSYSGEWPNLCSGILILEIDGEQVSFGYQKGCDYPKFWSTGGSCGFTNGYSGSYVHKGEWIIDCDKIPDKYKAYEEEFDKVFNDNVEYGCCGGCL